MADGIKDLSPVQIAEIQKAFSICDTDGNGEIDSNELAIVIRHITGVEPTGEEVARLLLAIDSDNSGTVSLQEFTNAMAEWLSDGNPGFKRSLVITSTLDEKKEVHHQIKGFFSQFRRAADYEDVRVKISSQMDSIFGNRHEMYGYGWYNNSMAITCNGLAIPLTSQQQLDHLKVFHENIGNLESILIEIQNSVSLVDLMNALNALDSLLSILKVFSKPSERSAIADDLAILFEMLTRFNFPSIIVNVLTNTQDVITQTLCLKLLALFAPGPRIPSTPPQSLMHPKQAFFKRMLIAVDAPLITSRFLVLNSPLLCEAAVNFIAAMVSHDAEVRDYYLENQIVSLLCPLVVHSAPIPLLSAIAHAMATLCGVSHSQLPVWEQIQPCLVPLGHLLFTEDEICVNRVLGALTLVLPGMQSDNNIITRILELTSPMKFSSSIVQGALQVILHVVQFDVLQTMSLVSRGLLSVLHTTLSATDTSTRSTTVDVILSLINNHSRFQDIINSGIIEYVIQQLPHDEYLRTKYTDLLVSLTNTTLAVCQHLVSLGVIPLLCGALSVFKEYDGVVFDAYHHAGPFFNFDLIEKVLKAIENILLIGELERSDKNGTYNAAAVVFDLECVERFRELLRVINESTIEGCLETWRHSKSGEAPLEQRVYSVLWRIKIAYEQTFLADQPNKDTIIASILSIFSEYFTEENVQMNESMEESFINNSLLVKCFLPDDIRVFETTRDVSFSRLSELLTTRFGRLYTVSFKDLEGDLVSLDESSFETVIKTLDTQSKSTINAMDANISNQKLPTLKLYFDYRTPQSQIENSNLPDSPNEESNPKKRQRLGSKNKSHLPTGNASLEISDSEPQKAFAVSFGKAFEDFNAERMANMMKDELETMSLVKKNQNFSELRNKTANFSESQLQTLFDIWTKDSTSGQVNFAQFTQGMLELGITDPLIIAQNFSAFDVDKDGEIDFREFSVALSTILAGNDEERLRFMFRSYDADNSGNLSQDEISNIFRATMTLNGIYMSLQELSQKVASVFAEIDTDGNGEISFEEFKAAVLSNKLPVNINFTPMLS